jgi:hypothetical protein
MIEITKLMNGYKYLHNHKLMKETKIKKWCESHVNWLLVFATYVNIMVRLNCL